jgi:hypothetical protein
MTNKKCDLLFTLPVFPDKALSFADIFLGTSVYKNAYVSTMNNLTFSDESNCIVHTISRLFLALVARNVLKAVDDNKWRRLRVPNWEIRKTSVCQKDRNT